MPAPPPKISVRSSAKFFRKQTGTLLLLAKTYESVLAHKSGTACLGASTHNMQITDAAASARQVQQNLDLLVQNVFHQLPRFEEPLNFRAN